MTRITDRKNIWIRFVTIIAAVLSLSGCSAERRFINNRDWKAASRLLQKEIAVDSPRIDDDQIEAKLLAFGLDALRIAELIELKNVYYAEYVEPRLDDRVTNGIDRLVEKKICTRIRMIANGKNYLPVAVYVITSYDPETYKSHLENAYADDSIHIPEFPESYNNAVLTYDSKDVISVNIDPSFYYLVKPRYYIDHTWENKSLELDLNKPIGTTLQTDPAVAFAIIAEKGIVERSYKVFWVIEQGP